jgi:hypothetical protein
MYFDLYFRRKKRARKENRKKIQIGDETKKIGARVDEAIETSQKLRTEEFFLRTANLHFKHGRAFSADRRKKIADRITNFSRTK